MSELPTTRKFLDCLRDLLRTKHYKYSTEESYVNWVRRYIFFHNKRHPQEMGDQEVEAFLTHLADELVLEIPKLSKPRVKQ